MPQDRLWSVSELAQVVKNPDSLPYDYKRERVTDGVELIYEYVVSYAADHYFTAAMQSYLTARSTVFEWTGFKHSLKDQNPMFGKKNAFRKSQMRTLMHNWVLPGAVICSFLAYGGGALLYCCCCSRKKTV